MMNRAALVTGASAGLGACFADLLAKEGYDLVLVARNEERLTELGRRLQNEHGVNFEVLRADLTVPDDLKRVEERVKDTSNPIDVLVNNAGFGIKKSFLASDLTAEQELLDVLAKTPMRLMHAALPSMKERNSGIIINVSSVAGWVAGGSYSAAKSYLTVLSESVHSELSKSNVKVLALCPGYTRTEFHDRGKMRMSGLPNFMWLNAENVVAKAWSDARAGKAISVPGWQYAIFATFARSAPRPLIRKFGINMKPKKSKK
ncbi:MAG: SDR family oxidoreductase [Candidatus Nanopelagicaceae bacterium]|nr:SDR family oxidoreductase [Candidatus Nanopelagicaceae bacterium]